MIFTHLDLYDRLTVTRVCSYWRQIALQTPLLWDIIDSGHVRSSSATFAYLFTWSRDFPLRVSLYTYDFTNPAIRTQGLGAKLALQAAQVLSQNMNRLASLIIDCTPDLCDRILTRCNVNALVVLDLVLPTFAFLPDDFLMGSAPVLRYLSLTNAFLPRYVAIAL